MSNTVVELKTETHVDRETMLRMLDEARAEVEAGVIASMIIVVRREGGELGDWTCARSQVEAAGMLALAGFARGQRFVTEL